MTESEEVLIRRAQGGDRAAFEELIRRTSRAAYARLCLETGDPHRAEDLLQETFVTAFRSIRQLADPKGFRPWLSRIAQNVVIDAARHDRRKKRAAGPQEMRDAARRKEAGATPDQELARREEQAQALSILRSLPEEYRVPLTLRYLGGADYETIGAQLGLSNGSLRGLLNRGLELLRSEVQRVIGPEVGGA